MYCDGNRLGYTAGQGGMATVNLPDGRGGRVEVRKEHAATHIAALNAAAAAGGISRLYVDVVGYTWGPENRAEGVHVIIKPDGSRKYHFPSQRFAVGKGGSDAISNEVWAMGVPTFSPSGHEARVFDFDPFTKSPHNIISPESGGFFKQNVGLFAVLGTAALGAGLAAVGAGSAAAKAAGAAIAAPSTASVAPVVGTGITLSPATAAATAVAPALSSGSAVSAVTAGVKTAAVIGKTVLTAQQALAKFQAAKEQSEAAGAQAVEYDRLNRQAEAEVQRMIAAEAQQQAAMYAQQAGVTYFTPKRIVGLTVIAGGFLVMFLVLRKVRHERR